MYQTEFPLEERLCYLNHAAVSPWPQRTARAVTDFARENAAVGSRHYARWLGVEQELRARLRTLINADGEDEIALLKSTSEALSVVAWGIDWQAGDEIVITNEEFPSNRIVWESLHELGVRVIEADIGDRPRAEETIIGSLSSRTRLVSVSAVQYSSGFALDLPTLGAACRARDIAFCVDAIQSIGARPFDVQACQADFAMADGHKWMLGPEGLAVFYCRRDWLQRLALRQYGWHMVAQMGDFGAREWRPADHARRFECGSPNMLGIHALHASVGLLLEVGIPTIAEKVSRKISYLIEKLENNSAIILSEKQPERRAGIVTFARPDIDPPALYQHLQEAGVVCALRGGGVRFSPHFYTPESVLERAVTLALEYN